MLEMRYELHTSLVLKSKTCTIVVFLLLSAVLFLQTGDGLDHCITFVCHLYRSSGTPVLSPVERESRHRVVFPHLLLTMFVALYEQPLLLSVRVSFVVLIRRPVKSLPSICS